MCLEASWAVRQQARRGVVVARLSITEQTTLTVEQQPQRQWAQQGERQQRRAPERQEEAGSSLAANSGRREERALREVEPAAASASSSDTPPAQRCRRPRRGEAVPRLLSVTQWRSSRPRRRESVTIVTQLSVERQAPELLWTGKGAGASCCSPAFVLAPLTCIPAAAGTPGATAAWGEAPRPLDR